MRNVTKRGQKFTYQNDPKVFTVDYFYYDGNYFDTLKECQERFPNRPLYACTIVETGEMADVAYTDITSVEAVSATHCPDFSIILIVNITMEKS